LLGFALAQAQEREGKEIKANASANAGSGSYPISEGWAPADVTKPPYYNTVLLSIIVFFSIPALLFIFANIIKSNPRYSFEECPNCKSIKLERVKKTFWDKLFSLLLVKSRLKRYQCLKCNWGGIKIVS